jgi:hypothetical protein
VGVGEPDMGGMFNQRVEKFMAGGDVCSGAQAHPDEIDVGGK